MDGGTLMVEEMERDVAIVLVQVHLEDHVL